MRGLIDFSILFVFSLLLTACVGNIDRTKEGAISQHSEASVKERIIIGESTKKDVLRFLGRPSSPTEYADSNDWFYYSDVIDRRIYFLVPVVLDEKITLNVIFGEGGVVENFIYLKK